MLRKTLLILIVFMATGPAFSQNKSNDAISQELKKIEMSIEELKSKILETKSQLLLLTEMFEKGTLTGTKLTVHLINEIKDVYKLGKINVFVNGYQVFSVKGLGNENSVLAYDESVSPGNFKIEVIAELTKKGGIFKKEKRFEISGDQVVRVNKSLTTDLEVKFVSKGKTPKIIFSSTRKRTLPNVTP